MALQHKRQRLYLTFTTLANSGFTRVNCALSPSAIKHSNHDHPLVLNFFLYKNRSLIYECDFCKEKCASKLLGL